MPVKEIQKYPFFQCDRQAFQCYPSQHSPTDCLWRTSVFTHLTSEDMLLRKKNIFFFLDSDLSGPNHSMNFASIGFLKAKFLTILNILPCNVSSVLTRDMVRSRPSFTILWNPFPSAPHSDVFFFLFPLVLV